MIADEEIFLVLQQKSDFDFYLKNAGARRMYAARPSLFRQMRGDGTGCEIRSIRKKTPGRKGEPLRKAEAKAVGRSAEKKQGSRSNPAD